MRTREKGRPLPSGERIQFPLTLDPAQDIFLDVKDKPHGISIKMIRDIAQALLAKRKAILKDEVTEAGEPLLISYPEVTLCIDGEDLDPIEVKGTARKHRIADTMRELCAAASANQRDVLHGRLGPQFTRINKWLLQSTGDRYGLGYRDQHLVIVDRSFKQGLIRLGTKSYPLLTAYRAKNHRALQNSCIHALAEAGLDGMPVEAFGFKLTSVASLVSRSNKFFQDWGFDLLCCVYTNSRLYLFDLSQPRHWQHYCKVIKQKLLSSRTGIGVPISAELHAWNLYGVPPARLPGRIAKRPSSELSREVFQRHVFSANAG